MSKLPVQNISIHTVLGTWERYEYNKLDNATVGVISYVENGVNRDFLNTPALWPTYVRANPISSSATHRVPARGERGYLKGHYFMQYWGDPAEYEGGQHGISERTAHVVHDAETGRVHHVHHRIGLGGPDTEDEPVDPLELRHEHWVTAETWWCSPSILGTSLPERQG